MKEFNEYCNKYIDELHKALTRTTEHLVNKRKELFGEDHFGKVRNHDVVCYVLHPDGPSAIFKTSAFHNGSFFDTLCIGTGGFLGVLLTLDLDECRLGQ